MDEREYEREALEDELTQAIALEFEGYGQAWWTDNSGDVLARVAAETAVRRLLGPLGRP